MQSLWTNFFPYRATSRRFSLCHGRKTMVRPSHRLQLSPNTRGDALRVEAIGLPQIVLSPNGFAKALAEAEAQHPGPGAG